MSFLASAIPSLVSAGAGLLSSKLNKPKKQEGGVQQFNPSGFRGGGLVGSFNDGVANVVSGGNRLGNVNRLASLFPEQANLTRGLRDRVSPGFSALRSSQLNQVEDARNRAIGNLKENLGRRRVLGSSFGQDALSRTEAEFGRQKAAVEADVELQEIGLTDKFIKDEFDLRRGEFTTVLSELNLQGDLAADLAKGATAQLAANARIKEQLNFKGAQASSAGAGQFFGQNFDPAIRSLGQGAQGFFQNRVGNLNSPDGSGLRFGAFGGGS